MCAIVSKATQMTAVVICSVLRRAVVMQDNSESAIGLWVTVIFRMLMEFRIFDDRTTHS